MSSLNWRPLYHVFIASTGYLMLGDCYDWSSDGRIKWSIIWGWVFYLNWRIECLVVHLGVTVIWNCVVYAL